MSQVTSLDLLTDQEYTQLWLGYCAANGVPGRPETVVANGLAVPGYVPPINLEWRTARGTVVQTVAIIRMTDTPFQHLELLQFAFGLPVGEKVSWKEYVNPEKPTADNKDPMVGDLFDSARRLFYVRGSGVQEGARYTSPSGRRFVAVRIAGPFTLHWQEI